MGYDGDPSPYFYLTIHDVLDRIAEFDLIHSHLEWASFLLARVAPIPVVSTFHGRLDLPWAEETFRDAPAGLVAISANQAATHPTVPWAGIVHNGLTLDGAPFDRRRGDGLCFVGRMAAEKGIVEAIEIALKTGRPLRIAAKAGPMPAEQDYLRDVFLPALKAAGESVEYLGELEQADRDLLFAESYASLMPGSWPEPFGLVAIEALACGTPVIARRVGALPEIIRDGVDGFFGDDVEQLAFQVGRVGELDREAIRESVIDRFSASRMTDKYEAIYRAMLGQAGEGSQDAAADKRPRVLDPVTTAAGRAS
jgi:glycosyltransferase involved in cell wall biosynthesis